MLIMRSSLGLLQLCTVGMHFYISIALWADGMEAIHIDRGVLNLVLEDAHELAHQVELQIIVTFS